MLIGSSRIAFMLLKASATDSDQREDLCSRPLSGDIVICRLPLLVKMTKGRGNLLEVGNDRRILAGEWKHLHIEQALRCCIHPGVLEDSGQLRSLSGDLPFGYNFSNQ